MVSPVRGDAGDGRLIVTTDATQGTLGSTERDVAATALARTLLSGEGTSDLARLPDSARPMAIARGRGWMSADIASAQRAARAA